MRSGFFPACVALMLAGCGPAAADRAAEEEPTATLHPMTGLLAHLDLDRPGLEKVRAAKDNPAAAARELLAYYRARTSVKHPVDRTKREEGRGTYASKGSLAIADDALRNVLIASPSYPRHDFGDDIDWLTNRHPTKDGEWLWQLQRHSSWGHLARAYWHTGEEKYAQAYARQLLDWIEKCPRVKKSPAWRTIEAGIRGRVWTDHFQHFLDAPSYTPDVLVRQMNCFHEHARVLYKVLETRGHSNWGLMEAEGLAFIAILFPEFKEAAAWRRRAFAHLNREIDRQIRPDGHHLEQCLGYHLGAITWFARTAELAAMNGLKDEFPPEYFRRIEAMCAVLLKLGLPDGSHTQFGDDHSQFRWRRKLARWAPVFERDDFLHAATGGAEGTPPEETAFALENSGFYSMRSGWDSRSICFVLKCGPHGGWHGQPDTNSFELYAFGRRLMPDSGTYTYGGDREGRRWFKQTRVHQTLTLDGRDSQTAPKLLLWRPGADLDTLVVENGSYKNLAHRRAALFVRKKFFVLVDEALGSAAGDVDLHFQLAPGEAVLDKAAQSGRTAFLEGGNVLVRGLAQEGIALEEEEGQVSFKYGTKEPRTAFRFRLKKMADAKGVRFVTLLVPYEGAEPLAASVALVGEPKVGAARIELDVEVGDIRARVGYDLEEKKPGEGG